MLAAVFCVSSLRDIVLAFSPSFRRGWGPLVVGDAAGARSAPRTGPGAWGPWSNKKQRSEADVSRLSGGTHPHSVKGWVTQRAMTGEGSETRSGVCERSRQGLCWRSARSPVFWSPRRRLPNREEVTQCIARSGHGSARMPEGAEENSEDSSHVAFSLTSSRALVRGATTSPNAHTGRGAKRHRVRQPPQGGLTLH